MDLQNLYLSSQGQSNPKNHRKLSGAFKRDTKVKTNLSKMNKYGTTSASESKEINHEMSTDINEICKKLNCLLEIKLKFKNNNNKLQVISDQYAELNSQISVLDKGNESLKVQYEEMQDEQRKLHIRMSRTKNEQYQDGILISGLSESEGKDLLDLVWTISKVPNVNLAENEIKNTHKLHSPTTASARNKVSASTSTKTESATSHPVERPRCILVRFLKTRTRTEMIASLKRDKSH